MDITAHHDGPVNTAAAVAELYETDGDRVDLSERVAAPTVEEIEAAFTPTA